MPYNMRFTAEVDLWVETSEDGRTWERCSGAPEARETVHTCPEFESAVRAYTRVSESMGALLDPPCPWFRVVAQGVATKMIIAVMPRRWDGSQYLATGGEWLITDMPVAFRSWAARFLAAKLADAV